MSPLTGVYEPFCTSAFECSVPPAFTIFLRKLATDAAPGITFPTLAATAHALTKSAHQALYVKPANSGYFLPSCAFATA